MHKTTITTFLLISVITSQATETNSLLNNREIEKTISSGLLNNNYDGDKSESDDSNEKLLKGRSPNNYSTIETLSKTRFNNHLLKYISNRFLIVGFTAGTILTASGLINLYNSSDDDEASSQKATAGALLASGMSTIFIFTTCCLKKSMDSRTSNNDSLA